MSVTAAEVAARLGLSQSTVSRALAGSDLVSAATRARVRDAVEGLKNFSGVGGVFSFSPKDHNGLDIDSFAMMTVKDGRFILYQEQ